MQKRPQLPDIGAFAAGDVAPRWAFVDRAGRVVDLLQDWVAGNWIVLCLHPAAGGPAVFAAGGGPTTFDAAGVGAVAERCRALPRVRFFAVVADGAAAAALPAAVPVLTDRNGAMTEQLGLAPPRPLTIVLRPDGHFAGFFDGPLQRQVDAACALVERAAAADAAVAMALHHPPVLLVPEVFGKADCRTLIEIFHNQGQTVLRKDRAVDHLGTDYKMRVFEHMREDRVDHFFFDPRTVAFLAHRLNRVIPEIAKAFQYQVTQYESLRMACYQGTRAGYGHGHRDNVPPTEYRRFAMSINLNTDEFDGGELRFPQFGDIRYRPESGTAIVFSSSLLHEALQVTRGRRYVFLAFMFGDR